MNAAHAPIFDFLVHIMLARRSKTLIFLYFQKLRYLTSAFDNPAPRFRPLHFNGKTVCTTAAAVGRFCGGSAPAPPASPKEQDKDKCVTGGRRIWDERRAAGIVPMCWNDYTTAPTRIQEKFDNRRQQTEAPRCGHLGLRHSPQTRMNTGFLGRSKPQRGAG